MRELNNNELMSIDGGGFSATLLNAITRAINTIMDVGRTLGSAIRRTIQGCHCQL